uniref:mannose-6-phosphate isomerase n=1 Tax=Anopheles farauti TaxID=69004 RepID=A0A182QUB9_9DIPT
MELIGNVKCYEWGKRGHRSFVAQLARANDEQLAVQDDQPYAELWMGDHVNGPARVKRNGLPLDEAVRANPVGMIGNGGTDDANRLPFLLKVLSIAKALSVQVHPDKAEAERLHRMFPDVYKDPNHKPELAIALTDFQALCGFRPYGEIAELLQRWPALRTLLGETVLGLFEAQDASAVRVAYERVMHSTPEDIQRCVEGVADALRTESTPDDPLSELFLRLHGEFGCDVGVLSIFFLNYVRLRPGEAIYLAASVPHAYLEGDCIECMACSDNVVRAGLTPKFKDVDTLLRLVAYDCRPAGSVLFQAQVLHPDTEPHTRTFIPPVPDFAVAEIRLPGEVRKYSVRNSATGSILLVVRGKGTLHLPDGVAQLGFGTILFLPSSTERLIELTVEPTDEPFLAFQAMRNDFVQ